MPLIPLLPFSKSQHRTQVFGPSGIRIARNLLISLLRPGTNSGFGYSLNGMFDSATSSYNLAALLVSSSRRPSLLGETRIYTADRLKIDVETKHPQLADCTPTPRSDRAAEDEHFRFFIEGVEDYAIFMLDTAGESPGMRVHNGQNSTRLPTSLGDISRFSILKKIGDWENLRSSWPLRRNRGAFRTKAGAFVRMGQFFGQA